MIKEKLVITPTKEKPNEIELETVDFGGQGDCGWREMKGSHALNVQGKTEAEINGTIEKLETFGINP